MDRLDNVHPGEILKKEFLEPKNITQYQIAKDIRVSQIRISEIVRGKRNISVDTAIRLSKYFETSIKYWLNLQIEYDIEKTMLEKEKIYEAIKKYNT